MSARRCPRCRGAMQPFVQRGVQAERCVGCGAYWYPASQLKRAIGAVATFGSLVSVSLEAPAPLPCPGCGAQMEERRATRGTSVQIEVCPRCKSVLLDRGELPMLAQAARDVADQTRAAATANLQDPAKSYGRAIGVMARRQANRSVEDLPSPPGVLKNLFMLLGLPVDEDHSPAGPAVMVWSLILLLAVIFAVQVGAPDNLVHLAMVPGRVLAGEAPWTLFTGDFLHGNLVHLLGNVYMLWLAGDNIEAALGRGKFLAIYFGSGLVANLTVLVTDPQGTSAYLGASGAIAGLLGAYVVLFPASRVYIMPRYSFALFRPLAVPALLYFAFWFALQFWGVFSGAHGVAFWAHIGGFVAGVVAGFLSRPAPVI